MAANTGKLRIIVGGMVGQFPLGGVAWDYFHYVLALHELGHDVHYYEDTNTWPYNPSIRQPSADGIYNANFIDAFFRRYAPSLADKWHYRLLKGQTFGMSAEAFAEVCRTTDIFLNVSGVCAVPEILPPHCRRVFMDTDPGYNQMGLQDVIDTQGKTAQRYIEVTQHHDLHLTYAENFHQPDCNLPDNGIKWVTTRPVVTLPHWRDALDAPLPPDAAYTTVMTLDLSKAPKRLHYRGVDYYDKRPEFEKFIALPSHVPEIPLTLAIGNNNDKTMQPLMANKWNVVDAHDASLTPEAYRQFIFESAGEWSIAKNVYAATNSGWFSCRTCCYLAAGRPAVEKDTKWSRYIPSGAGLFAFNTIEEAAAGLREVASDPIKHRRAAYEVAREYLAPDRVMTPIIDLCAATRGGR
jgi:hypothetical protein